MSAQSDTEQAGPTRGCGDLDTFFDAGPMFRRTVGGYDRFQVDSYVRWAEDELATAEHEREHLAARQLRTQTDLEEARQLLAHTAGGGEFLQLSRRLGSLLAAAADEAEGMRVEAAAHRSAACAQAERTRAEAERLRADARAEADRLVGEAAAGGAAMTAEAEQVLTAARRAAEDARRAARAEAEVRLEEVRQVEARVAEETARVRQQAADAAAAARLQARDEVVRMLGTARDERRRADEEAVATRRRLDEQAAARTAALRAEVAALQRQRAELRAQLGPLTGARVVVPDRPLAHPRLRLLERWTALRAR